MNSLKLLSCNKLSSNTDKTKFMFFRKITKVINPILYMNGPIIDSVKKLNILGLVLVHK